MIFLPIVDRELRIRARWRSTYFVRTGIAVVAIAVTVVMLAFTAFGARTIGKEMLMTLGWVTFGFCVIEGLRSTADSISEEKREGTIGLLFLTELHGYDLVLGKFIARSLNAFYALMALLPVVAISLLFGGLTGVEFWRTALALINALFVSLVVGTTVSSVSRDARAATSGTFAALLWLFAVFPALVSLQPMLKLPGLLFEVCWLTPFWPFYYAYEANYLSDAS